MRVWRITWVSLVAVLGLIIVALLYLGFADLGRHKSRIESLVTAQLGRSFTIEGPLRLRLLPEIQLHAEKIRLANAEWSAVPEMVRVGSITLRIGTWSLVSGPPQVLQLDLEDVEVELEKQAGQANWQFNAAKPPEEGAKEDEEEDSGPTRFPLVIHSAGIRNVQIRLRDSKQPALAIAAESMTVASGEGGLLDVKGRGSVDDRKVALDGQLGPVEALISGRDIRMDLSGSLDRFRLKATGSLGRMRPLQGADLKLEIVDPEVDLLLKRLHLPPIASGPMKIAAALKSAQKGTRLDLDAKAGDLDAKVTGTLQAFALKGSDLTLRVRKPHGETLLQALELPVVATGDLRLDARIRDAGRRRLLSLDGALGDLGFKGQGSFRAKRLRDADLELHVEKPEGREVLEALKLPIVATGPLRLDASLKYAEKQHRLDFAGVFGDLGAKVQGSLAGFALKDADLNVQARVENARRLGEVFGWEGLQAAPVEISGRLQPTADQLKLEAIRLSGANLTATVDGSISRGERGASLRVEARTGDLSKFAANLPAQSVSISGTLQSGSRRLQIQDLDLQAGDSRLTGKLLLDRGVSPAYAEAELSSPRLDLSPWLPKPAEAPEEAAPKKADSKGKEKEEEKEEEKRKYLFSEQPLPLGKRRKMDVRLRLQADEIMVNEQRLTKFDARVVLDASGSEMELHTTGTRQGSIEGKLRIAAAESGVSHQLSIFLKAREIRADLGADDIAWNERPPLNIDVDLQSHGESLHQLAAAANGSLLVVEGPGKVKAGLVRVMGGDVLAQLAVKLNPFREADPFTKLECMVAKARFVGGKVSVDPVLMQSTKVMVTAKGNVDLSTERMDFDFATRPRKGIGISPGMFTNPFLKLEGTLQEPGIGVGAKGVASGAVAAATAGVSVLAEGLLDRVRGEVDSCKKTLEAVGVKASTASAQ